MSLRGVSTITAMTIVAELGDLTRFDSPRQLVGFLGLAPGEHTSGSRRRQGATTKTGNGHVRRTLTETAWAYRFPARKTAHMRRKVAKVPDPVQWDGLGGPQTAVRSVCEAQSTRESKEQGGHGNRLRAGGLWLGHSLRGAGQASRHPGGRLSRETFWNHRHQQSRRLRRTSGCGWPVRRTLETTW